MDSFKPYGIWYGFADSWQKWCESEMPHWIYCHFYEIKPRGSNLLVLKTKLDMFRFNEEYGGKPILPGMKIFKQIEWNKVAQSYDGIEIPVYFWEFRLHPDFMWYYGFDVASGCIWNLKRVRVVELKNRGGR